MEYTVKYKNSKRIIASFKTFEEAFEYARDNIYDPNKKGLIVCENGKEYVRLGSQ
jgi:hypothetical protein